MRFKCKIDFWRDGADLTELSQTGSRAHEQAPNAIEAAIKAVNRTVGLYGDLHGLDNIDKLTVEVTPA